MSAFLRRATGILAVAAGIAFGGSLLALAIWYGPPALTHTTRQLSEVDRLKAINDVRGTLLTSLTASAALVGVAFTLRTVRISQRSFALQDRGQVTQRYKDALRYVDEALALGNNDTLPLWMAGQSNFELGNMERAEYFLKKAETSHVPTETTFLGDSTLRTLVTRLKWQLEQAHLAQKTPS